MNNEKFLSDGPTFTTIDKNITKKGWGEERLIYNGNDYCGKILAFNTGGRSSLHFHNLKHETWLVIRGSFILTWVDFKNGETYRKSLTGGDIIDLPQRTPHRLECIEEGAIFEVSTPHYDDDSYRISGGDSQKK